eukprot:scaffold6120_cov109-Isochrysis_galbana.AAC.4
MCAHARRERELDSSILSHAPDPSSGAQHHILACVRLGTPHSPLGASTQPAGELAQRHPPFMAAEAVAVRLHHHSLAPVQPQAHCVERQRESAWTRETELKKILALAIAIAIDISI